MAQKDVSKYGVDIESKQSNSDIVVQWVALAAEETSTEEFYIEDADGDSIDIVPIRDSQNSQQKVRLEIKTKLDVSGAQDLDVRIWDLMTCDAEDVTIEHLKSAAGTTLGDLGLALVQDAAPAGFQAGFHVDVPLGKVQFAVNKNLLYGIVKAQGNDHPGLTTKPLHVLLQRALVLFPGVMATKLYIDGETCWPRVGVKDKITGKHSRMLAKLACDENGVPRDNPSEMTVIEQPPPVFGPYHTNNWTDAMNKTYPKLRKRLWLRPDPRIHYHMLQLYPYDWRPKLETLLDTLLGPVGTLDGKEDAKLKTKPSYAQMPSLRTVVKYLKKKSPFFSDKINIAGHSTGGLVVNGLIRREGAENFVEKAFCIATPFQGSVKAFNAFIKGTMDLGLVAETLVADNDTFRRLASDLPVLYYLAPTKDYNATVATLKEEGGAVSEFNRVNDQEPQQFINTLLTRLKAFGDEFLNDGNAMEWKNAHQQEADAFHRFCRTESNRIGDQNMQVFYSLVPTEKEATYGLVSFDSSGEAALADFKSQWELRIRNADESSRGDLQAEFAEELGKRADKRYTTGTVAGDGTVPEASLKGGLAHGDARLVFIDGDQFNHLEIMTSSALWDAISSASSIERIQ